MRIQPWIMVVTGVAMAFVAHTPTSAQSPVPGGYQYAQDPYAGGASVPPGPGMYAPAGHYPPPAIPGGPADPQMLYPPGTPAEFQPWPTISPFYQPNVSQHQHSNRNGLWFQEMFYRRRQYLFSVEGMAIRMPDAGNARIGAPTAKAFDQIADWPFGQFQDGYFGPYVESPNVDPAPTGNFVVDPRIIPFPALGDTDYNDTPAVWLYPIRNGNSISGETTTGGLQTRLGFINEDYTGMMMNAFWAFEVENGFSRGYEFLNGVRVNQTITSLLEGQNLSPLNGNIPLQTGEQVLPYFGPGSTAKYDLLYSLKFTSEAGGSNISFYQQPLFRDKGIMIRPMWGMRYMYINEGFRFRGIDSGFTYTVDEETARPDGGSLERLYDQYEATLSNDVQTHIAGPEIGLRFDLGDPFKGFKIWGESIFGLNMNHEQIHLRGDNIGDPLYDVRINGALVPRILDDANFDSEFDIKENNTHVSPLFQQSIFADFNIMDTIPGLRRMTMFEDTTFRLGYTFLWVGGVSRPLDSIQWNGFPLTPQVRSDRQSWIAHQFSASIDWHF